MPHWEEKTLNSFPFEELHLPEMNLLKHRIVQFKLWDTDLAQCGAARNMARECRQCRGPEATRPVVPREATPHLGGSMGSKEAGMAGQAAPTPGVLQQ